MDTPRVTLKKYVRYTFSEPAIINFKKKSKSKDKTTGFMQAKISTKFMKVSYQCQGHKILCSL